MLICIFSGFKTDASFARQFQSILGFEAELFQNPWMSAGHASDRSGEVHTLVETSFQQYLFSPEIATPLKKLGLLQVNAVTEWVKHYFTVHKLAKYVIKQNFTHELRNDHCNLHDLLRSGNVGDFPLADVVKMIGIVHGEFPMISGIKRFPCASPVSSRHGTVADKTQTSGK